MASPAAILQVFVNANTKVASAQLAAFDRQLSSVGKTSAATGASMGKMTKGAAAAGVGIAAVGVAAVAAGRQLFQLGAEFDNAYDTIRVQTGATGRELERLKGTFRDVAKDVPSDFESIGVAIGDLNTRLGLTGKPLENMAENMLLLSELTGQDLQTNIKSVARSFVDWEVTIPKQTRALNGLLRLSQASGASVAEIADNVQKFGSPLRQLGFSFEEAAAMFANFERAGVNTQTMVPGLRLAISNLTKPTDDLAKRMAQLGIQAGKPDRALRQIFALLGKSSTLSDIDKTSLAMDVFGKRAGADMAEAIKQGRFELDRFLALMRDGDTIKKAYEDTADFNENMRELGNNLKVLVEPAAMGVFDALTKISQVLASDKGSEAVSNFGKVIKATFQVARLDVKGFIDTITGGEDRDRPNIYQRVAQSAKSALEVLSNQGQRLDNLRAKAKQATQAEAAAQQRLNEVRRKHGPTSVQAIAAEADYADALRRSRRAKERLNKAEQLSGSVRKAAKAVIKSSIVDLREEINRRKTAIRVLAAQVNLEDGKSAESKKKILRLNRAIIQENKGLEKAQGRVNKLILQAGTQIGPKFAEALRKMRVRSLGIKEIVGQLAQPIKRFGNAAKSEFDRAGNAASGLSKATGKARRQTKKDFSELSNAAEKSSKRIRQSVTSIPGPVRGAYGRLATYANSAAEAFGSKQRVSLAFRRGGMAKFSGPGLVPAMVSPGELISYKGREVYVPGKPEPRDSVMMNLPPGAKVFTFDGQARMAMGASQNEALRKQAPHFATGGMVTKAPRPRLVGGSRVPRATGQSAIDRARDQAEDWVAKLKPTLDMITRIARGFGLSMTSGYRPGDDGYHGIDRARDYSNSSGPTPEMFKFGTYMADNYQKHLLELIYTPLGFGIKNGARTAPYAAADHYDHVHVAMRKGGLIPRFKKGGFVGNINKIWGEHNSGYGDWGGPTLPSYVVAALAQAAGMPGVTMEQVTRGESGAHAKGTARPGATGIDPGGTKGHGLWMITSGYNEDLASKVGGWNQMLNPVVNAWAAAQIYRRQGLGAWYGTGSVTGDGIDYTGKYDIKNALGGLGYIGALYMGTNGKLGKKPKQIEALKKGSAKALDRIKSLRGRGAKGFLDAAVGNAREANKLAGEGEITQAKSRLQKARAQIRKAIRAGKKPGKPGQGGGGAGGGGGAAPAEIVQSLGIAENQRIIDTIGEKIDLFERTAGAEWSQGGSDYDQGEIAGLRALYVQLRDAYLVQKDLIEKEIQRVQGLINARAKKIADLRAKIANWQNDIEALQYSISGGVTAEQAKKWRERIKELQDKIKGPGTKAQKDEWRQEVKRLENKLAGPPEDDKKKWQKQITQIKGYITKAQGTIGTHSTYITDAQTLIDDTLKPDLETLVGLTGQAGLIGDTDWEILSLDNMTPGSTTSPSDGDSEIADLLRQQLQETQRALAISQAQMPIFQQFMPRFHQGGVVQGPMGAERPVMAQAGEGIFTRDQMRAMGSQNITVVIEDAAIDSNRIRVEVDGVIQDKVSTVRRQGSNRRFTTSR